jgi:GDP-L-fucose synthase
MSEYKDKKCLVTGGTGLIGRQVVDLLVDEGASVKVISLDDLKLNPTALYSKVNLIEPIVSVIATTGKDYVFHLAGIKASPDITNKRPATMSIPPLQINTNVLEACRINKVPKVLFTSSIGAYANSVILTEDNAYSGEPMDKEPGQVKRMAEVQIQSYEKEFGLKWVITRITNSYGIGDNFNPDNGMFVPSLMAKILRGDNPVVIYGDGTNVRDFAYSKDIARGILQMMINSKDTQPIN